MKHLHEEVLEAANKIASQSSDETFGVGEVVRALPHLNENSVRTHVVSRCCINAPRNHPHKWDYFRRVARGKYEVMPRYRQVTGTAQERPARKTSTVRDSRPRVCRDAIHAVVQKDETAYFAECMELPVITQGKTLDEVTENLRQAVALHLEDEDMASLGLVDRPRLQIQYDVALAS